MRSRSARSLRCGGRVWQCDGPYPAYGKKTNDGYKRRGKYFLSFNSFEEVQALIAMLWLWLGATKRQQASNALRQFIEDEAVKRLTSAGAQ